MSRISLLGLLALLVAVIAPTTAGATVPAAPTYSQPTPMNIKLPINTTLGGFPYGAYGLDGTDANLDGDYTDPGDKDPSKFMDQMNAGGQVYNLAVFSYLGSVGAQKITYVLQAAQRHNLKLIVRALALNSNFTVNVSQTRSQLARFTQVLTAHPELASTIYAFYSYDEPLDKLGYRGFTSGEILYQLHTAYNLYKEAFPNKPVLTVFDQNQSRTGCLLGQVHNPYDSKTADIVGLDVYPITTYYAPYAIGNLYVNARKVVGTNKPIWGLMQAHKLDWTTSYLPTPAQMQREVTDWLKAGPNAGIKGVDGLLWYSWHIGENRSNAWSDLESQSANRTEAHQIGVNLKTGTYLAKQF